MSLSLTPEQRRQRASIGGNARAGNLSPEQLSEISAKGQGALRARFVRQAAAQWPDLPQAEIERRAGHLFKSHMAKLALASSRARRKAGGSG